MKKVIIMGYYGAGNTGDEAFLKVILDTIRNDTKVSVKITVIAERPEVVIQDHMVEAISKPSRRNIAKRFAHIVNSDLFVLGGGGLLSDKYLLRWLRLPALANVLGKSVYLYGIGIGGPIKKSFNKLFTKKVCNSLTAITVRDNPTYTQLKDLGVKESKLCLTADPALLLSPVPKVEAENILRSEGVIANRFRIGISMRPNYNVSPYERFDKVEESVSELVDWLIKEFQAQVIFLPFNYYEDIPQARKIMTKIKEKQDFIILQKRRYFPSEFLSICNQMDFIIPMRFHSFVFSAMSYTPFAGLTYADSIRGFLEQLCLKESGIELKDVNFGSLKDLVKKSLNSQEYIVNQLRIKIPILKQKAMVNNKILLELIETKT